jgi:uncharacterized repeat protein (TIGR02543 family)
MFASGVVVAAIALAAPALAAANTTRVLDPHDVRGALDIETVTGTHVGANVVHTMRTYKPFRSQLLTHNTFITFDFDTNSNGTLDDVAIVVWFHGALHSALLTTDGTIVAELHVTRPNSRTVSIKIPTRLLGNPAVYHWGAAAEYQGKPGCKKTCYDAVPNRGTIKQQLRALAAPVAVHIIGPGRVFSTPHGIACPGQCVHKFGRGDTVWLSPAPIGTNVFVGWGGACSGTGVCKVTAGTSALSVIANFAPTFALTVVPVAPGSVLITPPGSTCAASQVCTQRYAWHTNVTLTAQAPPGYVFTGWSGACSGTTPTCTVTMDADQTVTAVFSIQPTVGLGVERIRPAGLLWSGDERARLEPW